MMNNYKYDIAISLCKQDIDFARKLVSLLNPSLAVFFYENNQKELISKSGPEEFAKIFKEQARVVVIISRDEWSKSFYTEIERNAIIDRTSVKNEGYNFLFVIPMEPDQIPAWYPSTRIYANPRRFSIDELVRFIEFKVVELGGILKPLTLEDKQTLFLQKMEHKKEIVRIQETPEAIAEGRRQTEIVKKLFNEKAEFLRKSSNLTSTFTRFDEHTTTALFCIGNYQLTCRMLHNNVEMTRSIVTTQDFKLEFWIFIYPNSGGMRKLNESGILIFYFTKNQIGWAKQQAINQIAQNDKLVLFRSYDGREYYDLINPISSENIVDSWFQILLDYATKNINRHL